jgi:hypothetical protein
MDLFAIYASLYDHPYDLEGHNVFYLDFLHAIRQLDPTVHIEHWADTWTNFGATLHTESWFTNGEEVVVYVKEDDCGEWVSLKG